jgi:hypothetical protein
MASPYSRDGKWLWTGEKWSAVPPGPPEEPPPPNPVRRLALALTGLAVVAATLVTVAVTIVQHV